MSDIVNVGICCVDAIGQTIDDYPPPGGLRLFDQLALTTGGNAVNCSIALGKMGVACDAIVKIGDDNLGEFVVSELSKYNVGIEGVVRAKGIHTPFSFACVFSGGQRSFFHTQGANGTLSYGDINLSIVKRAKFCFVTGTMVMKTFDGQHSARLLADAQKAGVKTLLDTVYVDNASLQLWHDNIFPCLPVLDYFIPSRPEAQKITGLQSPSDMARFLQDKGCQNVVIKMDELGAFCRDRSGHEVMVPAYQVDRVVDTTGAGDTWSAGFLAGLCEGLGMAEAALLGNATAAHCIQAAGASTGIVSLERIKEFQGRQCRRS
ncbi:MAG: carbohydrate kinase family protein [Phycisphaerae bacterium]|nr:carbohydrate kinase family protein [Phycisphaerae bacterium]